MRGCDHLCPPPPPWKPPPPWEPPPPWNPPAPWESTKQATSREEKPRTFPPWSKPLNAPECVPGCGCEGGPPWNPGFPPPDPLPWNALPWLKLTPLWLKVL